MKADHPNAKTLRERVERMLEDPQLMAGGLADDVVWHQVGEVEPLRGKQAVLDAMQQMGNEVTAEMDLYDVAGDDDVVVAYGRAHLTAGDRSTDYDAVEIHRLRDGKVVERYAMVGDLDAMNAFWSSH